MRTMKNTTRSWLMCIVLAAILPGVVNLSAAESVKGYPDSYNTVWKSPSEDCHGSMPLGNGDIGLNAWVEPDGDLLFYISKTDAWGDNARLLKVGRVRISVEPSPLKSSTPFRQVLRLRSGTMVARFGEGKRATTLRLWVDANHPLIHVKIHGPKPSTATAHIELWRTERKKISGHRNSDVLAGTDRPTMVEPDTLLEDLHKRIGWYHHNLKSVGPEMTMEIQGLEGVLERDPLLNRTFGAVIRTKDGKRVDARTLKSVDRQEHRFDICVRTVHPSTPEQWLEAVNHTFRRVGRTSFSSRRKAHKRWWGNFWDRSWIRVTADDPTTPPLVPGNDHPVRIGVDQAGNNQYSGRMGRVSIFDRSLSDERIRALAETEPEGSLPGANGSLYTGAPDGLRTLKGSAEWSFGDGLTVEAWVRPEKMPQRGGRIVDDLTPGQGNGFLLDTHPGNSLRFIVGEDRLQQKGALKAGQWWHVAATVDQQAGRVALYLNGDKVEERTVEQGSGPFVVSRGYTLQRFIAACSGRGDYPIKFNGSIFTVPYEDRPDGPDYRRWGPGYWWQNTRLPYYSMCASGDYEMMRPLFEMYVNDILPVCRARTERYFGHGGAFFPECMYFWGAVFSSTYGWKPASEREDKLQKNRYHKWEWVSGLELTWLMLDYFQHTRDKKFLRQKLLPCANAVLTFFDEHYSTNENGKLVMHPAQALETWWECTNPMPELAGLHAVTGRLLELPRELTTSSQRAFWRELRDTLPPLPTRTVNGNRALAPAETYDKKHNIENPELYAVFPFRLVAVGKPDLELGIQALQHRWDRGHSGWRQDDIFMAYLGLAEETRENVVKRARKSHSGSRFPAFWGPNYDWIPDQDHGSVLMKALQAMVMQTDGRKIYLLPAWPQDWNVHFKLHAPYRTTVECRYEDGSITFLEVSPEDRMEDVILPDELD